ncbi:hypothetical protein BTUL_0340g00070 [Botrytis tulipae]|uniref:Uncharacterized protein n=1 Tax=Botrytis tulipae TaxID=87230 RepID=A0A4Z1E4V7_9HELO|nr:hypothetical protein BTUL_0340g00070 [Botrytis tulipae]
MEMPHGISKVSLYWSQRNPPFLVAWSPSIPRSSNGVTSGKVRGWKYGSRGDSTLEQVPWRIAWSVAVSSLWKISIMLTETTSKTVAMRHGVNGVATFIVAVIRVKLIRDVVSSMCITERLPETLPIQQKIKNKKQACEMLRYTTTLYFGNMLITYFFVSEAGLYPSIFMQI